jgi:Arc/MetJ family transcription regulator
MRWRGEPLDDDLHLYLSPLTLLGRLESGTWKIAAPVPAGVTMTEDPSSVLAVLQAGVDRHGIGAELHSPRWTSRFRISTRRVDRMRVGNVFLAGDAAHLHSPVGGQGMNEGMQDAQNLAWKLALVLRGHVDESLLDSYDAEREPIIADVLADTSRMTRLVEMPEGVGATLRDKVIAAATRVAALQPLLREQFAGSYRDIRHSPLVAEDTPSVLDSLRAHFGGGTVRPNPSDAAVAFRGAARAGDRALDVDGIVADAQGTPFRLFASREDFFGHELLVFAGDVVDAKRVAALQDMARNIGVRHGGRVRAVVITKTPTAGAWHDSTGELHRRYGARYECLYLVRPDGFIAFRAQPATAEPLEAFLRERYGAGF